MSRERDGAPEPLFARRVVDRALDRARTRNPSERACVRAPGAIARALDRCARAFAEESARAAALRDARARAKRAATARPDARALTVLLGQAIETTDRRRRGTLAAIAECVREGRRTAERLRAFAEANEWTATELESSRAEEARAIGATKKALAKSEREASAALEAIVGGKRGGKRKTDAASADADAAPRTPGGKRRARAGPRIVASKPAASEETADDSDEEPMMTAEGPPEEESPAATQVTQPTQPASDEDSDGERALETLTSPTTKNVVQILMEMDLPNHGVSISESPEKDEDEN